MRRTKAWWASLDEGERIFLVNAERDADKGGQCAYLPGDCSECGVCGQPCLGYGPCKSCLDEMIRIVDKADEAMKEV